MGTTAAALATTVAALLLADAGGTAAAQGRLQAEFVATVAGVQVGHGNWFVDISGNTYTAMANGSTAGLMKAFSSAHGTGSAQGIIADGHPVPTRYAATITDSSHVDDVRIALANGNVTAYTVLPPLSPLPGRIPVSQADRRGVVDPMTSTIMRVDGSGDPVSPAACQHTVSVFDGRMRFDLGGAFKRMETVRAQKGYAGPAVVCALYFRPISGYVPDRSAIRYLTALRDAEVWLAPIAGTRMLVPFRFSIPTPLGLGVLQARQFISVAEPEQANAAANASRGPAAGAPGRTSAKGPVKTPSKTLGKSSAKTP